MNPQSLARGLSVFSITLGLTELLMPRKVAKVIGVSEDYERLLQLMGLREISIGLGILQGRPSALLWSRVAGDAVDLALLGAATQSEEADRRRVTGAIGAVAAVTLLDVAASVLHSREVAEPSWRVADPGRYRAAISGRGSVPPAQKTASEVQVAAAGIGSLPPESENLPRF